MHLDTYVRLVKYQQLNILHNFYLAMEKKIISIIARILETEIDEIELDTAIGDLPEWDSLHHLNIIAELEREFGIKYAAEDLAELEDVADLIALTKETIG